MIKNDPYDNGTPRYQTAHSIFEGLRQLSQGEEMGILSEMFSDVSYDGQDYYYIDKAAALEERFEELSSYGDKVWLMDLAVFQLDNNNSEIHDVIYTAMFNSDLAKRINFRKMFIEKMLHGDKSNYDEIVEDYCSRIGELDWVDVYNMSTVFLNLMQERGEPQYSTNYPGFANAVFEKVLGLKLQKEAQLIAECRALLYSYDDFILGLRMNQALFEAQEQRFNTRMSFLKESYEEKVKQLLLIAERNGIVFDTNERTALIETIESTENKNQ
jgi:hypothetical protein